MMKKKVFKIIIKHSRTSMQDRPAQKVVQEIKNSLPWFAKRHCSPEGGPTIWARRSSAGPNCLPFAEDV